MRNPNANAAAMPTPMATFGNTRRTAGSGGASGRSRSAARSPLIVRSRERLPDDCLRPASLAGGVGAAAGSARRR
jgi:hypothetical protein